MRLSLDGACFVSTMLAVVYSSVVGVLAASVAGFAGAAVVTDVVLLFAFVADSPLVAAGVLLLSVAGPDPSSTTASEAGCW